jgi:hypothetical protein
MSGENGSEAPQEVIDEEGGVDKAIKKRIIQARERVDETEISLYRDAEVDPNVNLSELEKIHIYATTVKQFLRRIEPLLRTANIPNNDEYYTDIHIETVPLVPPDTKGYPFSILPEIHDLEAKEQRRRLNLPHGVEVPEIEPVTFEGLKDIIEGDIILSHRWQVCVQNKGARPNWDFVYPEQTRPVPKEVYENAVRKADMFLQEAGIGVETDTKGTEIIRNFDMSGEQPHAEYGTADYDANPDI